MDNKRISPDLIESFKKWGKLYLNRKVVEMLSEIEKIGETNVKSNLSVNEENGFNEDQAASRRLQFGSNKRNMKARRKFTNYAAEVIKKEGTVQLLLIAGVCSIIVKTASAEDEDLRNIAWIEGLAIFVSAFIIISMTAFYALQKERNEENVIESEERKKFVRVLRDSTYRNVHYADVVVGDIIKIEQGMEILADGFLIEGYDVLADESSITGESDQIMKATLMDSIKIRELRISNNEKLEDFNVTTPFLISGSKIISGEGKFMVLLVGKYSSLANINSLLSDSKEQSILEKKLSVITSVVGKFGLFMSILIIVVFTIRFIIDRATTNVWNHAEHWSELINYFIIGLCILIVSIPEGLPLSINMALSFSATSMMKDHNLVRKKDAIETMGRVNEICSDKTGTLTANKMQCEKIWNDIYVNLYKNENATEAISSSEIGEKAFCDVLFQAIACNNNAELNPSPLGSKIEVGLLEMLTTLKIDYKNLRKMNSSKNNLLKYPFSALRRRMGTLAYFGNEGNIRIYEKGAPEVIFPTCSRIMNLNGDVRQVDGDIKRNFEKALEGMASQGLRTLCFAFKDLKSSDGKAYFKKFDLSKNKFYIDITVKDKNGVYDVEKEDFIFLAIVGFKDFLRNNIVKAIENCKEAGVRTRILTGDNKQTAIEIGKKAGILSNKESLVLEGSEFQLLTGGVVCRACRIKICSCERDFQDAIRKNKKLRIDTIAKPKEFEKIIPYLDILARCSPEDKYSLIVGLRERGRVVAVTGDGSNDAPAMKIADVSFSMGNSGTDIAKACSSIMLLDDNFESIVKSILWGRTIHDGVRKFIQFQMTVNFSIVTITLVGASVMRQAVLTPVQLLWVNLIMDTLASIALTTDKPNMKSLEKHPYKKSEPIITLVVLSYDALFKFLCFNKENVEAYNGSNNLSDNFNLGGGFPWLRKIKKKSHNFIPESYDDLEKLSNFSKEVKYNGEYIRSGFLKRIDRDENEYAGWEETFGPSRHFTFVFNLFVFLQIFNLFPCRTVYDEVNIFRGAWDNKKFFWVVVIVILVQAILVEFGGRAINCYRHGLSFKQWGIIVGFSALGWAINYLFKCMKEDIFLKAMDDKNKEKIAKKKTNLDNKDEEAARTLL